MGAVGLAAEIPAVSQGRLGHPWLPAPLRQLWLVRCCVAVGFQGWGVGDLPPCPSQPPGGAGSLRPVLGGTLSLRFPFSLGVVPLS